MPIYEYECECGHEFDDYLPVNKRKQPTKQPCPECNESKVSQKISRTTMGVDTNITPDKKTGGDWSRLMDKMKHSTPKRMHGQFDTASNRSGGKLGPQ
tara:strand:- start:78 stop:371 length:294 start_codon:yes stop_codon:yes gene_type:complete